MPAARKFQTRADSNSEDGVPAGVDGAAWERRMGRQKERRQGTDDLWSRLDELLVLDAGEFPHAATEPQCPLTARTAVSAVLFVPSLLGSGHCADTEQLRSQEALTGVVLCRRADGDQERVS